MAKKKLLTEVKKEIEKWKFLSGALVMCLVAYSNERNVQTFQSVTMVYLIFQHIYLTSNFQY
jgi:hypothetical protein